MASWKDNGRESKRFRSPNRIQQRVLKKERSHVDAEGVGKMRKKVGLEKRRRRNPSPTVKEEVGEKSVEEAPATNKGESAFPVPSNSGAADAAVIAGSATKQEAVEPKAAADPVKGAKMESKDAELKRRLKGKGIGGNKPRPMETEKITE